MDKLLLGFSTGCLYKSGIDINDRIDFYHKLGCNAIELGFVSHERFFSEHPNLIDISKLKAFRWVSFHAPAGQFTYGHNQESRSILDTIQLLHNKISLSLVVFHPDTFQDFSILDGYTFPISMENMDPRKHSYQTSETLIPFFNTYPNVSMTLDLNHAFVNDNKMNLAKTLIQDFADRIKEIQISGYSTLHDPLFKTKQYEILDYVLKDKPIINESVLENFDEVKNEFEFVLNYLS